MAASIRNANRGSSSRAQRIRARLTKLIGEPLETAPAPRKTAEG